MKLHIFENKEMLSHQMAGWICEQVDRTLEEQQYFTLVLSGGETPKSLYRQLASGQFKNKIDWNRIHVFFGDERAVPFDDERNNAKMAFDTLLNHVDIPHEQVHIMRTDIEPNFAVEEYRKELHTFFHSTDHTFDLVLLGMGGDGHTLSLFPGSTLIGENEHWVNCIYNEQQQMYRITLMPLIVNKARQVAFMVEGSSKAEVLQRVLEGEYDPETLPAQLIKPSDGTLHWFLDDAVAKKLHTI